MIGKPMTVVLTDPSDYDNEALAMVQALYSRSTKSVETHIDEKDPESLKRSMERYAIEYGHRSILDCSSTTVFLENVSMLAAKSIQDYQLYNGQESSTRYIPFDQMGAVLPTDLPRHLSGVQEDLLKIYYEVQDIMFTHLNETLTKPDDVKDGVWEKTLKARAFDVARGWLPCGQKTNLSWHTTMRQFADRTDMLRHHPLEEVRELAGSVRESLEARYPHSFDLKRYDETEMYYNAFAQELNRSMVTIVQDSSDSYGEKGMYGEEGLYVSSNLTAIPDEYIDLLTCRPFKAPLPAALKALGNIEVVFPLDFASFRDIQRHRSLNIQIPRVSALAGMHSWYYNQLPEAYRQAIVDRTNAIIEMIESEETQGVNPESLQYLLPMGVKILVSFTADINAIVYLIELRTSKTVHPTLRKVMQHLSTRINAELPEMKLYTDLSEDDLDPRRGEQDIVEKSIDKLPLADSTLEDVEQGTVEQL